MMRLGIMGGTFDPVHNAHLELARCARDQYKLSKILFVPAGKPIRKLGTIHATAQQRYEMLRRACKTIPAFAVSTMEIDRPGITYTIDTLKELQQQYPQDELCLIMGEDAAKDLDSWKDSEQIAKIATILYAKRPGSNKALGLPTTFTCKGIDMPALDISSSEVRQVLARGEDASALVPPDVLAYITDCGLYAKP